MTENRPKLLLPVLLGALLAAPVGPAFAAETPPFAGTWSGDIKACSLSDDEDETRLRIGADTLEDYHESCALGAVERHPDGSYRGRLTCPGRDGSGRLRIYMRDRNRAVFAIVVGKRRRSREGVRCAPEPLVLRPGEALEGESSLTGSFRRLSPAKQWLHLRQVCARPGPDRDEACAERRRLGRLLREQGQCHFTRGTREGWRPCGARGG